MSWRDRYRQASFRGVSFRVDTGARSSGRRGVTFEFPKRDKPSDEDMGRRAARWSIDGWVIGPDHDLEADDLERALNQEGPGQLVHPTMGQMMVRCDIYTRSERRTEGGVTGFNMTFVEAGTPANKLVSEATQATVKKTAETSKTTSATATNGRLAQAQYPPGGA